MGKNTIELTSANTDNLNKILSTSEEKQNKLTAGIGISLSSTSEISAVVTGEGDSYINVSVSNQTSDNSKHIGVTLSDAFLSIIENLQNTVGSLQETVEDLQEKVDELDKEVNPGVIYLTPEVSLNYGTASASSTSLTPTYSYSQTVTDDSGNIVETITSGGTLTFSLSNASSGTTINNSTGMLSFSTNETYSQVTLGTVTLNVTLNGKTGSASQTIYQMVQAQNAGDVLFYDKTNDTKLFVPISNVNTNSFPSSQYTPIGVVAIPSTHDVYGTGEAGVVSIVPMSYSTPDTGGTSEQSIYWGQYGVDTSLTNYTTAVVCSSATSNSFSRYASMGSTTCLPSDQFTNTISADGVAYYGSNASNYIPSPYLSVGSFNSIYSQGGSSNVLSDLDGKTNTSAILELATAQSDWKTASTITNNSDSGYSPAACCCWRYHTDGTSQGDWYLPSMGELGYVMVRLKTINNSISTLSSIYGVGLAVSTSHSYWSSSEYSSYYAVYLSPSIGYVDYTNKSNSSLYVRAFCRL